MFPQTYLSLLFRRPPWRPRKVEAGEAIREAQQQECLAIAKTWLGRCAGRLGGHKWELPPLLSGPLLLWARQMRRRGAERYLLTDAAGNPSSPASSTKATEHACS